MRAEKFHINDSHTIHSTRLATFGTGSVELTDPAWVWMMLQAADRIFLLTGEGDTTVVIEQERTPPFMELFRHQEVCHLRQAPTAIAAAMRSAGAACPASAGW